MTENKIQCQEMVLQMMVKNPKEILKYIQPKRAEELQMLVDTHKITEEDVTYLASCVDGMNETIKDKTKQITELSNYNKISMIQLANTYKEEMADKDKRLLEITEDRRKDFERHNKIIKNKNDLIRNQEKTLNEQNNKNRELELILISGGANAKDMKPTIIPTILFVITIVLLISVIMCYYFELNIIYPIISTLTSICLLGVLYFKYTVHHQFR